MRSLDHFVMPVADLTAARARYTSLGFTVANDARHPFGTENCCVFFMDSTFIEPLAIGNMSAYQAALVSGNAFVKGHFDYCERNGQEGFSHLVVKSFNAGDDHRVFSENAVSGGEILDFERSFMKADGTLGEVAFSLAFARAPASPDTTFFACQIVKALPGGRGSLINHANGALATNRVILSARLPKKYLAFFQVFLETQPDQIETGLKFETATGALHVISAQADDFGVAPPGEPGLKLQALVLQVADLKVTRQLLAKNNISVHDKMNRIIVPPALGQGGTLVFEE